jgi:hypothetical protein
MKLEAFSRNETSTLVESYGATVLRSNDHVSGVASPTDNLVEKGRHQHATGTSPLPSRVDGHRQQLAPSTYPGSTGSPVSQRLQYPTPTLDHATGRTGSGLYAVVPEEALVQAGHVCGAGDEPGGLAIALRDDQERVRGRADPLVETLQEAGTQQGEESA